MLFQEDLFTVFILKQPIISFLFFPAIPNILKIFTLTIIGNVITKILGMRTTDFICFSLYLHLQNERIAFNENTVFWNSSLKIIKMFLCFRFITLPQLFRCLKNHVCLLLYLFYEITKMRAGLEPILNANAQELKERIMMV